VRKRKGAVDIAKKAKKMNIKKKKGRGRERERVKGSFSTRNVEG
jgi:hypothetical protein